MRPEVRTCVAHGGVDSGRREASQDAAAVASDAVEGVVSQQCRACQAPVAVLFDVETHRPSVLNDHAAEPIQSARRLCAECASAWLGFGEQGEERR